MKDLANRRRGHEEIFEGVFLEVWPTVEDYLQTQGCGQVLSCVECRPMPSTAGGKIRSEKKYPNCFFVGSVVNATQGKNYFKRKDLKLSISRRTDNGGKIANVGCPSGVAFGTHNQVSASIHAKPILSDLFRCIKNFTATSRIENGKIYLCNKREKKIQFIIEDLIVDQLGGRMYHFSHDRQWYFEYIHAPNTPIVDHRS